jgi:hypothetical protein
MTDPIIAHLDRVRKLADAATDGPWEVRGSLIGPQRYDISQTWGVRWDKDAEFIAAARTDVPMLVDALTAVMEYVDDTEVYGQDGQGMTDYEAGYTQALKETQDDVRRILETKLRAVQDAMRGAQ